MSQYVFSEVPHIEIPRSTFDRSHEYKSTFESAGVLYPILVDEVLPSDTFTIQTSLFCRVATLIAPIMDNLYLDTFYFFVPERLVWNNFQKMCGEQENPGDSTDFTFPIFYTSSVSKDDVSDDPVLGPQNVGSLADYFGIPTGVANLHNVRCEPFRCYNLIWRDWFRDENLQDSPVIEKGDKDYITNYSLLRRGKRKDYFTSALPWPVKDGTGVELPIHGTATIPNVDVYPRRVPTYAGTDAAASRLMKGAFANINPNTESTATLYTHGSSSESDLYFTSPNLFVYSKDGNAPKVSLSNSVTTTINEFREAFQVQRWLERCARSGTRYTEIIRGMFGCVSPDARLQRPEYLGGTTTLIDVNVVPQTSATGTSPQANLSAYAVGLSTNGGGFTKSFTEHGWIIGLACVRSDYTYQQGLNRMWNRRTKYDMYWPTFAHLGEQAVLNKEIYAQGVGTYVDEETALAADDYKVFGYQERYAEYRYYPSMITGKMRSTYAQSLDYWHLSQKFDNLPVLNSEFIQENPPVSRVIAVPSEPQFLVDIYFNEKCIRPMPLYSVPGLVDHF